MYLPMFGCVADVFLLEIFGYAERSQQNHFDGESVHDESKVYVLGEDTPA